MARLGQHKTPLDDKTLGGRLRDLRKRRGLSQAEVADHLSVHQSLVSEYERGTVRVPSTILAALVQILGTSTDQLLGVKKAAVPVDKALSDRRFIRRLERIDKLPKRAKQALLKTIDTYLLGSERIRP